MSTINYGANLWVNDGEANAYVEVPKLISVMPPEAEWGDVEQPHLNGTSRLVSRRRAMARIPDITFTFEYTGEQYARFAGKSENATANTYKIRFPDDSENGGDGGAEYTFPAWVKKVTNPVDEAEGIPKTTVTLVVTDWPTVVE